MRRQNQPWKLLFDPDLFNEQHGPLHTANFELTEDQLMQWAVACTQLRTQFRNSAFGSVITDRAQESSEDNQIARLAAAIEKREHSVYNRLFRELSHSFKEDTPVGLRRRGKKAPKI